MISRLRLKNFRSVHEAQIDLTPLTVLIGANGTGKSNLIKALQFVSSVSVKGLPASLEAVGGAQSLVPRALVNSRKRSYDISIGYDLTMRKPFDYDDVAPPPTIEHDISIRTKGVDDYEISRESINFHQVLFVLLALTQEDGEKEEIRKILQALDADSTIRVSNAGAKRVSLEASFGHIPSAPKLITEWLGWGPAAEAVKTEADLRRFVTYLIGGLRKPKKGSEAMQVFQHHSLLDPRESMPLDRCEQAIGLRWHLKNILRYDLLINHLRQEQETSSSTRLQTHGGNLPGAYRAICSHDMSDPIEVHSVERLERSLTELAPHVNEIKTNRLKNAKEFVSFVESKTGMPVESWDSSDGTLRALGILVSLEQQTPYTTVMIEEPELHLHPWAVRTIMRHIEEVQKSKFIQVVLTTHSPQVLEFVSRDQVLIVERDLSTGTRFVPLVDIAPFSKMEMGEIGRLWVKGALRGVPG